MEEKLTRREVHHGRWLEYGFQNLLLWLFVYLVLGPFLESIPYSHIFFSSIFTLVLISAVVAMNQSGRLIRIAFGILILDVALLWLEAFGVIELKVNIGALITICLLMIVVCSLSKHLFTIRRVTGNVICAALCLYLIIGLLWAGLFALLESLSPGSFSGALLENTTTPDQVSRYLQYFSYVTLSTLGYGDITPQTLGAATLCQTEAIIGQFLTVVLVARLVGIQVAQESETNP